MMLAESFQEITVGNGVVELELLAFALELSEAEASHKILLKTEAYTCKHMSKGSFVIRGLEISFRKS